MIFFFLVSLLVKIDISCKEKKKICIILYINRCNQSMDLREDVLIVAKNVPKEENRQGKMKRDKERVSEVLVQVREQLRKIIQFSLCATRLTVRLFSRFLIIRPLLLPLLPHPILS